MNFNWFYKLIGRKPAIVNHALWCWYMNFDKAGDLLDFCKNKNISELYVANCTPQMKVFIKNAHKQNVKVKYLEGDIKGAEERIIKANALGFDGMHLDLEVQNDTIVLELNKQLKYLISRYNCESDVEGWRYKDHDYRKILSKCPSVCFMGYKNTAKEIIRNAKRSNVNVPFFIGVETNPNLPSIAFSSLKQMSRELIKVYDHFKYDRNFRGFAYHCYGYFNLLK